MGGFGASSKPLVDPRRATQGRVFRSRQSLTVPSRRMRAWQTRIQGEEIILRGLRAKTCVGVAAVSRAVRA